MTGAILLGLLEGLLIALLGFGVVLVYKAERFVNLAHSQLGVIPALVLAKLVIDAGASWYVAFPVAVALGAAIGAACRWFVIARLEQASRASLMIATLGLSQLIVALAFFEWLGPDRFRLRDLGYPVPFRVHWSFDGLAVTSRYVLIVAVVPATLIGLIAWLHASPWGRTLRAAAANPTAARLAGVDLRRTATATWAIAGALSAIGAAFSAPGASVPDVAALSPSLLLSSLGAAALVGFMSLPGVLAAGVALGVVSGVGSYMGNSSGAGTAALFATIVLGLLVRSIVVRASEEAVTRVERSEEPLRIPEAAARRWFLRPWAAPLLAAGVGIALPFMPWLSAPHRTFVLASTAVFALTTLSLTLLIGWGGQVSLGQFAFVAIGAFIAARLAPRGWSLLATMVVAAIFGGVTAVAVGLPSARARGMSSAVTSLGLAVVGPAWLFQQPWVMPQMRVSAPAAYELGFGRLATQKSVYFAALAVLVAIGIGLTRLRQSTAGRSIVATRDNARSITTFGFSPVAVRLATFAASGGLAAIAGVLWLAVNRNVSTGTFDANTSLLLVSAAVIGGVSYVRGAVIGAVIVFGLPLLFHDVIDPIFGTVQLQLLLSGGGLLVTQIVNPGGIASARRRWLQHRLDALAAGSTETRPAEPSPRPERPTAAVASPALALHARDIRVSFGGVHAVDGVSFHVAPGEIVGLIGANGAGKTALLDAICGLVPASGSIVIGDRDLATVPAARRARAGMRRGFQDARLFAALTARETIELGLAHAHPTGAGLVFGAPWARLAQTELAADADAIIDRFGLRDEADTPVDRLSTGVRHLCELAAAVASRPRLLILDEPTSGVAQREAESLGLHIRDVVDELGCAVVIVEHDMRLLMSLADRVYCLDGGRVIAEASPADVQRDPAVVASYLGVPGRRRSPRTTAATR